MSVRTWFYELRPQFLLLNPCIISVGVASAFCDGFFNPLHMVLSLIGVLLCHISVNVLNDYFDYKSGIDMHTRKTPFSGGSGILPSGLLNPKSVYRFGVVSLLLALSVGFYFVAIYGWHLIPLIIAAGVSVYFYTTRFARWMVGELVAGFSHGSLVVLGSYVTQTGYYGFRAFAVCIAPGFLPILLLLLNEFPDIEVKAKGGRRNIPIVFGRRTAAKIYSALVALTYVSIIIPVILGILPIATLIALATIPFALRAVSLALKYHDDIERLLPALKANVLTALLTPTLMSAGMLVSMLSV